MRAVFLNIILQNVNSTLRKNDSSAYFALFRNRKCEHFGTISVAEIATTIGLTGEK